MGVPYCHGLGDGWPLRSSYATKLINESETFIEWGFPQTSELYTRVTRPLVSWALHPCVTRPLVF